VIVATEAGRTAFAEMLNGHDERVLDRLRAIEDQITVLAGVVMRPRQSA
jgi:hypothetical protein